MVQVRSVESALRIGTLYRNSPYPLNRLFQMCARNSLQVLGTINHPDALLDISPNSLRAFCFPDAPLPQLYSPAATGISVQLITFDRPNPVRMQYMSSEPISLALVEKNRGNTTTRYDWGDLDDEEEIEQARVAKLVDKLRLHTVSRNPPSRKEKALFNILNQINSSLELSQLLQRNASLIGSRRKRSRSVSERVVESAQSLYSDATVFAWNFFFTYIYPFLRNSFLILLIGHRAVSELVLQVLEWQPPHQLLAPELSAQGEDPKKSAQKLLALKDFSATLQQIHIRLQQFSYYPIQYLLLRQRQQTWSSITNSHAEYIRFFNSLWLVANDVIIGIALGSYIIDSHQATADLLGKFLGNYAISGLENSITWLMGWPAGLKLNGELAEFLGALSLWVIECWSLSIQAVVLPYLPTIIYFIGFSSFAGASMPIAIFSDILSLLTLHIHSFYIASARIFNWQLTIIYSLFQLFRGKKRNVLRHRIDSCDYDLDQLLLGTILFTVLFFLLPTVAVFYLTYAFARMSIIVVKAGLDTCLACLNHFPLFALMLRVKDAKRLPGGIHFAIHPASLIPRKPALPSPVDEADPDDRDDLTRKISYIHLSSTPLSLRHIFAQYSHLAARIRKHYFTPQVIFRLFTGRFVPPLGRSEMYGLQYSMLPRTRVSVGEVWRGLVDNDGFSVGNGHVHEKSGRRR